MANGKTRKQTQKNGNPTVCMTTNEPNVKIEPFAFVSDQRLYASPFFPPIEGRQSTQGVDRRSAKKKHHANDRIESKRPMNWLGAGEKGTKVERGGSRAHTTRHGLCALQQDPKHDGFGHYFHIFLQLGRKRSLFLFWSLAGLPRLPRTTSCVLAALTRARQ